MKRVLAMILSSMVAVSMLPTFAFAAEEDADESSGGQVQTESVSDEEVIDEEECDIEGCEDGDWIFDYIDGNAIITGSYISDQKTLTIPSTLYIDIYDHTAPVVGIAEDAEIYVDDPCTKLIIPESIKSIGKNAFVLDVPADTNLLVDCQCGSAGEKWALENRCNTTNGVTKNVTTKAGFKKKGSVTTTCKKCGAYGTHSIEAIDFAIMVARGKNCAFENIAIYNGKNIPVLLELYDTSSGGMDLTKGVDYTLSGPSTVKNVGTYKYTITLKGWYSGTKKLSLTVVPKSTTIKKLSKGKKSFTVKWKKQTSQTTGYQIRYSTSKSMKKAKTVTVKGNKKNSKKIKKLKKKKTYYVQVRTYKTVKGKKYAIPWGEFSKKVKTK
jgi:hypothetical protein